MNFLNEIVLDYPDAVSFAPGRPSERFFQVEKHLYDIGNYVAWIAGQNGRSREEIWQNLGQYNRTNGTVNDLIVKQLEADEGIRSAPESIMVTVGAQEAMAVLLTGLFDPGKDILLASDPTYIGITGLAKILGIQVVPVSADEEGLAPQHLEEVIKKSVAHGNVRALYDIPDFNNPLGTSLLLERRLHLIEVCRRYGLYIFEDNPYEMFVYEGERMPNLKALDSDATVIYIGSYSKTLFPGLRLGYLLADQRVASKYGVVVCPMQFFALQSNRENQVRLSFSYVNETQIRAGVERFARFVRDEFKRRQFA